MYNLGDTILGADVHLLGMTELFSASVSPVIKWDIFYCLPGDAL